MNESCIRFLFGKYTSDDLIQGYIKAVQDHIMPNDLGNYWISDNKDLALQNVPLNGCVIWYEDTNSYAVIATTDLSKTAKKIIDTYCLRPEIEEDYRQLKDFWKLCVLFGYLFFQLYTMLPDGVGYSGKSLPVLLKRYESKVQGHIVIYVDDMFGVFTLFEVLELYVKGPDNVKALLGEKVKAL